MVFDWMNPTNKFKTPDYFTYKLIETLLPRAMNHLPTNAVDKQAFEKARRFRMIELWAQDNKPRKGWLKVQSLR